MGIVYALISVAVAAYIICDLYKRIKEEVNRHKNDPNR